MASRKLIRRRRGVPIDWQDETLRQTLVDQGLRPPGRPRNVSGVSKFERELRRLVKLLRQQAGIPVRLPGHNTPPYRALPICFSGVMVLTGGDGLAPVRFRGGVQWSAFTDPASTYASSNNVRFDSVGAIAPEGFPEAELGTMTSAECWVYEYTTDTAANHPRDARWGLLLNGAYLPGYALQLPSGSLIKSDPLASIKVSVAHNLSTAMVVPVKLKPGDQLEMEFAADSVESTSQVWFHCVVKGYRYPSRGADGTVYDTLVD